MTKSILLGMSRATDLTRAGNLTEATALIQSLLAPKPPQDAATATATTLPDPDVIEGRFHRVDEAEGPSPRPEPKPEPRTPKGRKGLGDTLRDLASRRMPRGGAMPAAQPATPPGAQFLALTHTSAHGTRGYRLYVPASKPDGPMPLIVMLHGCTQSPEDFATGTGMNTLAEKAGCLVAWPAQPQGANAQKCWNWFRPEDQARDRGEPALLAGIIRDIQASHPADPARTYVAGLSAGGAAAAIMGAAYPDLIAAIGVHSGLPAGGAQDVMQALSAMRSGARGTDQAGSVPTIVFHGLADTTVHPSNGAAVIAQTLATQPGLTQARHSGISDGGRSYQVTRHTDHTGRSIAEHWQITGASHAWAGGQPGGSYTDPNGPSASAEMLRFFAQHRRA